MIVRRRRKTTTIDFNWKLHQALRIHEAAKKS